MAAKAQEAAPAPAAAPELLAVDDRRLAHVRLECLKLAVETRTGGAATHTICERADQFAAWVLGASPRAAECWPALVELAALQPRISEMFDGDRLAEALAAAGD